MINELRRWTQAFVTGTVLFACSDDKPEQPAASVGVQFEQTTVLLNENSDDKTINLLLNQPAASDGVITIKVDADGIQDVIITPAVTNGVLVVPVTKGSSVVTFTVSALNNSVIDGDRSLSFTITEVSEGLVKGQRSAITVSIVDDEGPVAVNFLQTEGSLRENTTEGSMVTVVLSSPAVAEGTVEITAVGNTGLYVTEPPLANGKISLTIPQGATSASFKVLPLNNAIIQGHDHLNFTITSAQGSVTKGASGLHHLTIIDDELEARPKSYYTAGGIWTSKREYTYNENGSVSSIRWESHTPGGSSGVYTYVYDDEGRLQRINRYPEQNEIFTWSGKNVIKKEEVDHGVVKKYTLYEYDDYGNVSVAAVHHLQPTGEFKLTLISVFFYFLDGNLYKHLKYVPVAGQEEPVLVSTHTYGGYLDVFNPFQMVEILPTVRVQSKLPTYYRVEENGADLEYHLSYTFRSDGLPVTRYVSGAASETTEYTYY